MKLAHEHHHPSNKIARQCLGLQAEEVFDLRAGNHYRNTIGETDHDWPRNKTHGCSETGDSENQQEDACHQRAHVESIDAISGHNPENHHHKGPGRAADLGGRTAERRYQKSGNDSGIKASLRPYT